MAKVANNKPPVFSWVECRDWLDSRDFVLNLQTARLGSALLVHGRSGVGKRQFIGSALAEIFCETSRACGACAACRQIVAGIHPEVLWCDGEEQIKLETVASIQEHLAYRSQSSASGRSVPRVAVLIGAERLNLNSANRLLKILEEPPEGSYLILSSSHLRQLA